MIAALADGTLDRGAREAALRHLAGCGDCRADVAAVSRALGDGAVAREVALAAAPRRGWRAIAAVAGVAALALLLVRPQSTEQPTPALHRAPVLANGSAPRPVAPVGLVTAAAELRWAAVPGADRYRVTLFDADGRALFETQLADTLVRLADSLGAALRGRYLWKVEARTGFDRWVSSSLVEFSIAERGAR